VASTETDQRVIISTQFKNLSKSDKKCVYEEIRIHVYIGVI